MNEGSSPKYLCHWGRCSYCRLPNVGRTSRGWCGREATHGLPLPERASEWIETIAGRRWKRLSFLAERVEVFALVRFLIAPTSSATHLPALGSNLSEHPRAEEAEVIHLHWVQQGFLSMRGLQSLLSLPGKRFFWTLHDLATHWRVSSALLH